MNPIVLSEPLSKDFLYPFTLTRSVLDIRIGMLTLREKWEYLAGKRVEEQRKQTHDAIPANIIPSRHLIEAIKTGTKDFSGEESLDYPWQIFQFNDAAIRNDFVLVTNNRKSTSLSDTNQIISPENVFIEEGVKIEHAMLNASTGPIYISKNAEIMEGSMVRGPFFLGEESIIKMGTKIYGATSIGKKCVIGGEVKNSVIFDCSNKAHDGYIGDSVIGQWCNLGAGTSNSNLKNNAGPVKVWNEEKKQYISAGAKCGLLLGDYSRSAINTSFNTGTVTGICCNIFGSGLTPKHIPNFSWGFGNSFKYEFDRATNDIARWKRLKNEMLRDSEIQTLKHIFENS